MRLYDNVIPYRIRSYAIFRKPRDMLWNGVICG